jgi:hypothetical protein
VSIRLRLEDPMVFILMPLVRVTVPEVPVRVHKSLPFKALDLIYSYKGTIHTLLCCCIADVAVVNFAL